MRFCFDSVDVNALPPNGDLYLGYTDGHWPNAAAVAARFPGKTVVRCTVFASDNMGDCLDVEAGDATPDQAPGWVARRRAAGHQGPLVYCSESAWPTVRAAFHSQGVPEPGYWVAAYPGEGAIIPAGAVAHQWGQGPNGAYDVSVVVDYLPGIDPPPTQAAHVPTPVGDDMQAISLSLPAALDSNGNGWYPVTALGVAGLTDVNQIVSIAWIDEDPAKVGRYDHLPSGWAITADQQLVVTGGAPGGRYGCRIFFN